MTKLGIDDLRIIPELSEIARTSQAGIEMMKRYRKAHIGELVCKRRLPSLLSWVILIGLKTPKQLSLTWGST